MRKMLEAQQAAPPAGGGGGAPQPRGLVLSGAEEETTGAVPVNPEIAKMQEAASIYKTKGAIGKAAAESGANIADQQAAVEREQLQTQSAGQIERMNKAEAKAVGRYRKILDDIDKDIADDKIDPRRFWTEKGAGEKVMLGIASVIAGIGGALSGTNDNVVLDGIRRNIDLTNKEDLRQAQAKEKHGERVENAMKSLVNIFGDERQAAMALTSMKLSAIEQALLKRRSQAKTALERANLDTVIGQLVDENTKTRLELDKLSAGKHREELKYSLPKASGGGGAAAKPGAPVDPKDMEWIVERYNQYGMTDTETALRLLGESVGLDGGQVAKYAAYNPGYLNNMIAGQTVKDPQKLQRAAAAFKIATHKFTGAALTPDERADVMRGFDTSNPQALATTAKILGQAFRVGEAQLESAKPEAYQLWSHNREQYLNRSRPSVAVPGATPEKVPK
jgi:hypothetical protein